MNRTFFFLFSCALVTQLNAQNITDKDHIVSQTNIGALNEMATHSQKVQNQYRDKKVPTTLAGDDGNIGCFSHFGSNGAAIGYELENESSAISSRVNEIRTGGIAGLGLDGSGINIGLWDGGNPRTSHRELDGKITISDASSVAGHATHVAGILVANGIIPEARGMAPSATVESFTTSGWFTEVAAWAAEGGMITNHSYILDNPREEYQLFGIYNVHSRDWDALSYNAPYLIMCTGASNNGNNNFNPNGSRYDLLASNKVGKNAIVVGACEDVLNYTGPESVVQAVFTSWGPTDDWRIKPDLAAVGTNSFSSRAGSDNDYTTGNGSSFAGPIVAGGLALLQQHFHDLNDVYMKAVTAKALILSTADEAGEFDGPDFSNGWGLFNARRAADVITNNGVTAEILELSLNQGEVYTKTIMVDGAEPLTVAICWNDPPAEPLPNANHNDPTIMLINDLDLRVIADGVEYFPWKMEPNATFDNYTAPAKKGDNYRDNTEVIFEGDVPAGEYTISVTHKNQLQSGNQDFSMVINGIIVDVPEADVLTFVENVPAGVLFGTTSGEDPQGGASNQAAIGFRNSDGAETAGTRARGQSFTFATGDGLTHDIGSLSVSLNDPADDDGYRPDGQLELTIFEWNSNNPDNFNIWDAGMGGGVGQTELYRQSFPILSTDSWGSGDLAQISFGEGRLQLTDGATYGFLFRYTLDSLVDAAGNPLNEDVTFTFDSRQDNGIAGALLSTRAATSFATADNDQSTSRDMNFFFTAPSGLLGDVNSDGVVNFLDISPFIGLLGNGGFLDRADINGDGVVNFLDISPFIALLNG